VAFVGLAHLADQLPLLLPKGGEVCVPARLSVEYFCSPNGGTDYLTFYDRVTYYSDSACLR
jgi:hypothetical protein